MAETTQISPTAQDLDPAWMEEFAKRWLDAWNSHEPERLLALMTEDIVYDDSAWPTTMRGHADVRAFLDSSWTAIPDLRFELIEGPYIVPGQPKAAFHWRGTGTHTGPLNPPGFAATARSMDFTGVDFHEYRDGRVCKLNITFDMARVAQQLGLMPKPGSRIEKFGAAAQRMGAKVQSKIQERRPKK
jgi:steroid delta-isomerase-like uncharacterized protein